MFFPNPISYLICKSILLPPLLKKIPNLEAQLMKRLVKMCKTMYLSEYKSVSFLFRFCMERVNRLMGRNLFFVCQQSGLRMMEILRGTSLCIAQCTDEERKCAEFVRELLDLRDGLLHVDILSQMRF